MRTLIAALLMLCSALPAMADVTKEDVRKLVNAGISDKVIVQFVQTNGPVRMSVDDLTDLKKIGASEAVLGALVAGIKTPRPETQTTVVVEPAPVVYYYYGPYYYYRPYYYGRYYYYRPACRPVVVVRPTVVRPVVRTVPRHR